MSDDLKRYGYAPGNYTCICGRCDGQFIGDKRAITCKGCALAADRIAALEAERDQALAERDDNAAALREFIADRDRLEAEVARLRQALEGA